MPVRIGSSNLAAAALVAAIAIACSGGGGSPAQPATVSSPPSTPDAAIQAGSVPAKYRDFKSDTYAKAENWMCRPDLVTAENDCLKANLDTTVIAADGRVSVVKSVPVSDAPIDCFYVYPTVPVDVAGGGANDLAMAADKRGEVAVLNFQFARFREVCNAYAPLYRQLKLSAFASAGAAQGLQLAYGDVRDAFAYYMAHFNKGKPFILIGHSQGAMHLTALLREEFDKDPDMRSRLVAAYIIGGRVGVPEGREVGGDLENIPLCRKADQTGCVVTYASFAASDPPPGASAIFGRTIGGAIAGCVNPAALDGGKAPLSNYLASAGIAAPNGQAITTPWVSLPNAVAAECVRRNGYSYLEISAAPLQGDARNTGQMVRSVPGWGLHLTEVNLTMGNLLDLVKSQGRAFH